MIFYPGSAYTKIYKCKDAEGTIAFQETRCPKSDEELKVEKYLEYSARASALHTMLPRVSTIKPDCKSQSRKCLCEKKVYSMRYARKSQINKFMERLHELWGEYNKLHHELKTYTNLTSDKYTKRYALLDKKACEILVYQKRVSDRHNYRKKMLIRDITIIENRVGNAIKNGNSSAMGSHLYKDRYKEIELFILLSSKIGIKVDYKYEKN